MQAEPVIYGDVVEFERAWRMYSWLKGIEWRHLPAEGGLENQEETLMSNIFAIMEWCHRLDEDKKAKAKGF